MNVTLFLRKIMKKYFETTDSLFSISAPKLKEYISSFNEPVNDAERSFYQYKCTLFRMNTLGRTLVKLSGMVLYLPYLIKIRSNSASFEKTYDAVFMTDGISLSTIPSSLVQKFPNIVQVPFGMRMCMNEEDVRFSKAITRDYRFHLYFKLKLIMKLGMYSAIIEQYRPKAIISYAESSFTSSILTKYCEDKGIEHISIMHGERIFNLKTSFFRFSNYYVWDNFYIKLMTKLRCASDQYIVEVPPSVSGTIVNDAMVPKYFMTYYLEAEGEDTLLLIREALQMLKNNNKKCSLRIHPRAGNSELVHRILGEFDIQTAKDTTLNDSLANTDYVASVVSTVLFEGWVKGKKVIIDNYCQKSYYEKLKELDYIMLTKPHLLLADIIDNLQGAS